MQDDKLVAMANQIAIFFQPYPQEDALAGIGDHIRAFWTPSMCRALRHRIEADSSGIDERVVLALTHPSLAATGASPIIKDMMGPGELGQAASDAG